MAAVTWPPQGKARQADPLNVSASFTGTAQDIIAAPSAGSQIVIDEIIANVDTVDAVLSIFAGTDETGNRIVYNKFQAGQGVRNDYSPKKGLRLPAATALKGTVSTGNCYYVVFYHLEVANSGM